MDYQAKARELYEENGILRAQLEGHRDQALSALQAKIARQRKANDALQRRVVNQRFVLSTMEKLGRGLTKAEWDEHHSARPDAELEDDFAVA